MSKRSKKTTQLFVAGPVTLAAAQQPARSQIVVLAVALLLTLVIVAVLLVVFGLIRWASRQARRVLEQRGPVHTHMPDIWFLTPRNKPRRDGE